MLSDGGAEALGAEAGVPGLGWGWCLPQGRVQYPVSCPPLLLPRLQAHAGMQHYGVNGYSLHAMNSLSAMYNLHQQAAQQAQHAPDYRPSVHALTLAERLAGKGRGDGTLGTERWGLGVEDRSGWEGSGGPQ